MKKIFLAILLSAGTTFVFAQTKTAEAYNATEASRQMYNDLQLNEAQYLKIRQINQVKQDRMRDMEALYRNDPQMMEQKRAALNAELDAEYRAVLRPDQMDMYLSSDGRGISQTDTDESMMIGTGSNDTDQETKIKSGDTKMKSEAGESKVKSGDTKIKSENGETKVKTEHTKTKNEKDKYKHQDSRDNSKIKATDDKLKIENKDSKIKVEEDKVKIKSRD